MNNEYFNMNNYRMYIDESGDHAYSDDKNPAKRYLGLLGLIIEKEHYIKEFQPNFENLKQKYFSYHPDDPVILHRKEIINKRGHFWVIRNPFIEKNFNTDLLNFLIKMKFTIIVIVIDKKSHFDRYKYAAKHPYHYCLNVMIEKYCDFLKYHNAKGDILVETMGGKEDMLLKKEYQNIYESGTLFRKPNFFSSTLSTNEIKLKSKNFNIAGLQVADLLAYPCKIEILFDNRLIELSNKNFGNYILECIKEKYNQQSRFNEANEYHKIFLP